MSMANSECRPGHRRRLLAGILAAMISALVMPARARAQKCYVIQNNSSTAVGFTFTYNHPIGEGVPTGVTIPSKGKWGPWCWDNMPEGWTATVTYQAQVIPSWDGTLVVGKGLLGYPAGTYVLRDPAQPSQGSPGTPCLPNTYPGNNTFCLVRKEDGPTLGCGTGHGGSRLGGPYRTVHLKIACHDGRKWTLTCPPDGTKCNLNDKEFCVGLSQWNVGQHCTERATPNGF